MTGLPNLMLGVAIAMYPLGSFLAYLGESILRLLICFSSRSSRRLNMQYSIVGIDNLMTDDIG